ncbi:hypothetical protein [Cellulomonas carbonis]|uniref:MucB/RseB N-terminal domain-containing protein n=1 Tax=Cellulomonas carbonis T26 TaxID=947969 RepID=A0A0A0BLA3_9CELL|nr:hypothetical protein [Cellulomonas carbonis]KGM09283.1 hypothetical protein N868_03055 [Cellulomonas carbonis T26]GGB99280.1 membrane protein [Cellulomonas carbonis]
MSTSDAPVRSSSLRSRAPWAVPVGVAVAVAAAFGAPPLLAAAGDADLPDVTAEELLARVAAAEPVPVTGTVVYTARLGLPELPVSEATGADPLVLLGGSSTLRVWSDGGERSRVSLLGTASEYSVVHDGPEAWTYSSVDDEVVHYTLDAEGRARYDAAAEKARDGVRPEVAEGLPTPEELARTALTRAEEHSTVSVDAPTTVAGRPAYQAVVTPRTSGTLVDRVVVAVDHETSAPLRVQVWSTQDPDVPALEIGFTDVSFSAPDAGVLEFSAPAGAEQREVVVPTPPDAADAERLAQERLSDLDLTEVPDPTELLPPGVTVTGEGWDAVTEVAGVDVAALLAGDAASADELGERVIGSERAQELIGEFRGDGGGELDLDVSVLYEQLTTEVPEGRLLSSTLLSVLVTPDGRVLVGAVPAATLLGLA